VRVATNTHRSPGSAGARPGAAFGEDTASPRPRRAATPSTAEAFATTFGALADLPRVVAELQARLETLEGRLTVAERRPYSVADAAAALGVSQKTIRRRVADGSLRTVRTGSRIAIYLDEPTEDEVSAIVLGRD
jgi:excisionase family DNA binding protein